MTERTDEGGGLLPLAALALLVGLGAGLVGALFRLALVRADDARATAVGWAHQHPLPGFLALVAGAAAATALSASMVRRLVPAASGSGIPHVEAVLEGTQRPAPLILLPVKFIGGTLAIGAGLALGREGPSVQMAASVAHAVARAFRRGWADCRALIAAGAGAGLATAFNAPVAGAVFVLEELVGRFEPRMAIVALGASASAMAVARSISGGGAPDFIVAALPPAALATTTLALLLGLGAGLLGSLYCRCLLASLDAADRLPGPPEVRAGAIGAGVGALAFFAPGLVGGGDPITQGLLLGHGSLALLPLLFLLRLTLSTTSYAAGTPGGLFAPMLVLGAQAGLAFCLAARALLPGLELPAEAFAIVGMAAFFTAAVRAPLTGIALVTELTGNATLLLPMLAASFAAMLVPALLGTAPIYASLRRRADAKPGR